MYNYEGRAYEIRGILNSAEPLFHGFPYGKVEGTSLLIDVADP